MAFIENCMISLHVMESTPVNSLYYYNEILKPYDYELKRRLRYSTQTTKTKLINKSNNYYFLHDGALCHKSKHTRKFLNVNIPNVLDCSFF